MKADWLDYVMFFLVVYALLLVSIFFIPFAAVWDLLDLTRPRAERGGALRHWFAFFRDAEEIITNPGRNPKGTIR